MLNLGLRNLAVLSSVNAPQTPEYTSIDTLFDQPDAWMNTILACANRFDFDDMSQFDRSTPFFPCTGQDLFIIDIGIKE